MAKNPQNQGTNAQNAGTDDGEWEVKEVSEDLPAWDSKLIPRIIGKVVRAEGNVLVEYEGEKRPRTLVVLLTDDGEKLAAWLPTMYEEEAKAAKGKRVRITRTGTGKRDTRFEFAVSRRS